MFDGLTAVIAAQQLECLANAVYHEARGESFAGQIFVGFVIKNRVLSDRYPDTFCQVIKQPHQFSFYHVDADLTMKEQQAKIDAEQVAYMVMTTTTPPIPTNVMYFHTVNVNPDWNYDLLDVYATVGNHVFYENVPRG